MGSFIDLLPAEIVGFTIGSYLMLNEIAHLDSAVSSKSTRSKLSESYASIAHLCGIPNEVDMYKAKWICNAFPVLREIEVHDADLDDNDIIEMFNRSTVFTSIVLSGGRFTSIGLGFILNRCVNIQKLTVLNNDQLHNLVRVDTANSGDLCNKLTEINLSGCSKLSNNAILFLARYAHALRSVVLQNCWLISNDAIGELCAGCPNLSYLDFSNSSQLTDPAVCSLLSLHQLQHLALAYCPDITSNSLCLLISRRGSLIQTLDLSGCDGIDESTFECLAASATTLISLKLSFCRVLSDEAIHKLSCGCLELQYLSLTGWNDISDSTLRYFHNGFPNLLQLDLMDFEGYSRHRFITYSITPDAVRALCESRTSDFVVNIDSSRYSIAVIENGYFDTSNAMVYDEVADLDFFDYDSDYGNDYENDAAVFHTHYDFDSDLVDIDFSDY
mmetsp:Transcript_6406/g.9672  ORF Transcript_6406/g.9672 Transcript_6406/m.9672 type:complete len:444 (+) Transcript_6406:40-1371(+)